MAAQTSHIPAAWRSFPTCYFTTLSGLYLYSGHWRARLGTPKAITAMAHKLARILWHLFKYREAFNPEVFRQAEEKMKSKRLARLQNTAAALGLKLVPAQ